MLASSLPTSSILENGVHVVDIIRQIATQDGLKEALAMLAEQKKEIEEKTSVLHTDRQKVDEDAKALAAYRAQLDIAQKDILQRLADIEVSEKRLAERTTNINARESALATNISNFEAEVARQKSVNETLITEAADAVARAEKMANEAQAVKAEYEQKVEALKRAVV